MDRHFGLPLAFAAAAHGALLFGFGKPARRVAIEPPTDIIRIIIPPPQPDDPPPDADSDRTKPDLEVPPPIRGPEPIPIESPEKISITVPPITPVDPKDFADKIATAPVQGTNPFSSQLGPIIRSDLLDNSPRTRFQPPPTYPFEAKRQGLHGDVVVEFIVDESGRVRDPRVVSSTHRVFEEPTLRAVARWQFEPGCRGGVIVRFRMMVPVMFNLND